MSNPTSNFNWQMPTNTDLVSQLPADFEVFGQAVDTSLADLKGGTTGQVLKKNTDTDMDFVWAADSAGMTNPMTTTGDTIYSSSGSTPARLGIGSTGQVLTVAGGIPSWATAPGFNFTTWTPTFSDLTLGNGSYTARYAQNGKFTYFELAINLGSTSSVAGIIFSLPATPKTGSADVYHTVYGTARRPGSFTTSIPVELRTNGNAVCKTMVVNGDYPEFGNVSSTAPFTWSSTSTIFLSGEYEAA
jgi:hypothetical protein